MDFNIDEESWVQANELLYLAACRRTGRVGFRRVVGGEGFGRVADILLGISGAFLVRFIMEQMGISLGYVNLLLLSICGAAAASNS